MKDSKQHPSTDILPFPGGFPADGRFVSDERNSVKVTAGETLALMMHAARTNRAWLKDFADETIEISEDLYEVLLAYKRFAFQENSKAA